MRIEGIHIDGFGHFRETPFMPLAPGMNVFFGPNEAGKSTLLAFIQAVLYGFPRQRRSDHYPPLNGGRHGGRLWIADEQGRPYIVARHAASAGKDLAITLPDHSETTSEDVLRQLLSGASKDVFTSVFSFGIAELQAIESLSGGEIGSQIYSAGIGAGAVPAALASLAKQEEDLFKRRGQKHAVADLARELDDVEALLRDRREDDAQYAALERERAAIGAEAELIATEHSRLQYRASRAQRLLEAWGTWSRTERLRADLAALGDTEVEAGAVARLDAIEARLQEAEEERAQAAGQASRAELESQSIVVDRAVLDASAQVEQLRNGLGAYAASLRDLPKREQELEVARQALAVALGEMGHGWTVDRCAHIDASHTNRIAIEGVQERLATARRELERQEDRLEAARERYDQRRAEHRRAAGDLAHAAAGPALDECEERLTLLRACTDARAEVPVHRQRMAAGLAAIWLGGGLVLGAAPGYALGGLQGAVAGGAAGVVAAILALARRSDPEHARAQSAFREVLSRAGVTENDLAAALRQAELELARAHEYGRHARAADETAASLAEADEALKRAAAARDTATKGLAKVEAEWEDLAAASGFEARPAPAVALHLMAQARLVADRARAVAELEHRTAAIGRDLERYASLVRDTARACGSEGAGDAGQIAEALLARLESARRRHRQSEEAVARAELAKARLEECESKVNRARASLAAILSANGAADAGDLRRRAEVATQRVALLQELRECESRLSEAAGTDAARFANDLRTADPDGLQADVMRLNDELAALADQRDRMLERRGSIDRDLEELRAGEGTSSLLLKRERLRAELEAIVRRWSEIRVARRLIERTRGVYEAERQPRVVKAAEEYFAAMTGGRYTRVIAPLGETALRVADDVHAPKTPEQLSRGTREQLYLALRFGLIDQFAERGGPLPVAVDEVLVNFDPDRAREAARGFARLSRRHQVIAFTCHPWVVELFREAEPNARVWELGGVSTMTPLAGSLAP